MAFCIALDGPAGAGKSVVTREVSARLGMDYLDTGAMYRAMGLYMLRNGIDPKDGAAVAKVCAAVDIDVEYADGVQRTMLMGEDVSAEIRTEAASKASSAVSAVPEVRERLVALQREIAGKRRIILDGRDIGTTVLPDAPLKIYLTASAEERARRRVKQLMEKNEPADYDEVLKGIIERDERDMNRAVSPLRKADDAVLLDSTDMTQEEVVARVIAIAREAGA